MKRLRLLVDARKLGGGGVGRYVACLLRGMATHAADLGDVGLIVMADDGERLAREATKKWATHPKAFPVRWPPFHPLERRAVNRVLREFGPDVLHVPHYHLPCNPTHGGRGRPGTVITAHDWIPLEPGQGYGPLARRVLTREIEHAVRDADVIVTVSAPTLHVGRKHWFPDAPAVWHLAPPAVDPALAAASTTVRLPDAITPLEQDRARPVILHVASRRRHKRSRLALRAFTRALELLDTESTGAHHTVKPVLALVGTDAAWLARRARRAADRIVVAGAVDDATLAWLYERASVLLLPSAREGFGMPLIEAGHAGTPAVIAEDCTGAAWTAGEGAIVAEPSRDSLADALVRLLIDRRLRDRLGARACVNAARFNWRQTAAATREAYELALAAREGRLPPALRGSVAPTPWLDSRPAAQLGLPVEGTGDGLRVLAIHKDYPPTIGGVERVVEAQSRVLVERLGARVRVFCCEAPNALPGASSPVHGIEVTRFRAPMRVASMPLSLPLVEAVIDEMTGPSPPDVLHLHEPFPLGTLAVALGLLALGDRGKRRPPRIVVGYHSDVHRQRLLAPLVYWPWLRFVLDRADVVHVHSPPLIARSPRLHRHHRRVRLVPIGIDPPAQGPAVTDNHRDNVDGEPLRLLAVGRLVPYKGLDVLLDALGRLAADSTCPGAHCTIVGDGPLRDSLAGQAGRLGLLVRDERNPDAAPRVRVRFRHAVDDAALAGEYARHDAFVLPSTQPSEAFGIVQVEAMARGLPIINTALPTGVPWVSVDGETGLTVPPGDAQALAAAIAKLAADAHERRQLGEAARARYRACFTHARMADALEAVFREHVLPNLAHLDQSSDDNE